MIAGGVVLLLVGLCLAFGAFIEFMQQKDKPRQGPLEPVVLAFYAAWGLGIVACLAGGIALLTVKPKQKAEALGATLPPAPTPSRQPPHRHRLRPQPRPEEKNKNKNQPKPTT